MTLEFYMKYGCASHFFIVILIDPYQPWLWYHKPVITNVLKKWHTLEILNGNIQLKYVQGNVTLWKIKFMKTPWICMTHMEMKKNKNKWCRNNGNQGEKKLAYMKKNGYNILVVLIWGYPKMVLPQLRKVMEYGGQNNTYIIIWKFVI